MFRNINVTFQEIYGSFAKALKTAKDICKVYAGNTFSECAFKMHSRHGSLPKYIGLFSEGTSLFAGNIGLFSGDIGLFSGDIGFFSEKSSMHICIYVMMKDSFKNIS